MRYVVGIDDFGTEKYQMRGWAYFLLPLERAESFCGEVFQLQQQTRVKEFHGKKFTLDKTDPYRSFIELIRKYVSESPHNFIRCSLLNPRWNVEFRMLNTHVVNLASNLVVMPNEQAQSVLVNTLSPLLDLLPRMNGLAPDATFGLEMDADRTLDQLARLRLTTLVGAYRLDGFQTLAALYNGYRLIKQPMSPRLDSSAIKIVRGALSPLVQASDVIANFAMSTILVALGDTSNKRLRKSELLNEIMENLLPPDKIQNQLEVHGCEFRMKPDGRLLVDFVGS